MFFPLEKFTKRDVRESLNTHRQFILTTLPLIARSMPLYYTKITLLNAGG